MQVIEHPTRSAAIQSGLVDSSSRYSAAMPVAIAEPVSEEKPKTIKKKVVKKAAVAPAPAPEPEPVKTTAPKTAKAVKIAEVAPALIPKAEPAKKVRAKKVDAEKKAIAKAAETPTHSDDEAPVAVKATRKGRFEKGSEEAKAYMRSLREKASAKKSAKSE